MELSREQEARLVYLFEQTFNFLVSQDIKFFLAFGTLIGALRHGRRMPWDDDIDIGMLRSDYEHFKYEWSINPPPNLFLQDRDTEPKFPPPFIKIRKENTLLEESAMKELGIHQGIFIDIFPFDKIGKSSFLNSIQRFFLYILDLATLSVSKEICEASSTKFSKILRYIFFYLKPILNSPSKLQSLAAELEVMLHIRSDNLNEAKTKLKNLLKRADISFEQKSRLELINKIYYSNAE